MDSDGTGEGPPEVRQRRHRPARTWPRLPRSWPRSRRAVLAAGGGAGALVAAAVAVAVSLGAGATPACAAPPAAGTEYTGQASHYVLESGGGNCSYPGPPADDLYAALSPTEYDAAAACGGYLDVTGPNATIRVKVVDQCPECAAGHIDLSRAAFARIADLSTGIVPVTYTLVADPPLPGPLGFRVKDGASQWWFAVLVLDHGNPLATVEARASGGWQPLQREDYNYWLAETGLGEGPYDLRVTDTAGHQVTVSGVQLAPEQVQTAGVAMYGGSARPTPAPAPQAEPSPDRPASTAPPEPSPDATASPSGQKCQA